MIPAEIGLAAQEIGTQRDPAGHENPSLDARSWQVLAQGTILALPQVAGDPLTMPRAAEVDSELIFRMVAQAQNEEKV